jgi:preprotein translocase subunit SecG
MYEQRGNVFFVLTIAFLFLALMLVVVNLWRRRRRVSDRHE